MGSHVRTGGSAHMGGMRRRSPESVFRMIPRFCPKRVVNERLTSLDPAPDHAVRRPLVSVAHLPQAHERCGHAEPPRSCRETGAALHPLVDETRLNCAATASVVVSPAGRGPRRR